jgi:hypothetical protein
VGCVCVRECVSARVRVCLECECVRSHPCCCRFAVSFTTGLMCVSMCVCARVRVCVCAGV